MKVDAKNSTRRINLFKLPFSRWVVLAGFLFFAVSGWMRMSDSLTDWYWLDFAGVWPGPRYLAISGAVWGFIGTAALGWILVQGRAYRLVGFGAALILAISYWADRLLFSANGGPGHNALFAAAATLMCLAYVYLDLSPGQDWQRLFKK